MATILKILSQEIKDKYIIVNNSFRHIAKPSLKDLLICEIGDVKTPDTFIPQMKIGRWGNSEEDNECNVSIRLIHNEKGTEKVETIGDKIKWSRGNLEAHFYDISEGEGGSEFEIILKSKPKTNVINFSVADKDVDYFYQPALTSEEITEGANRSENVVGSYAIYAKTPKTNWTGGKEYKCGKIGHIFRPKIIDNAGKEIWGILNIDKGILSIEIDQKFLDEAVYPVIVDPTFGYTTLGGTIQTALDADSTLGRIGNPGENGIANSISFGSNIDTVSKLFIGGLYQASDMSLLSPQGAEVTINSTTLQWWTSNITNGPSISNQNYYASVKIQSGGKYAYDLGGNLGDSRGEAQAGTYPTWENPWVGYTNSSRKYSIYATYEASGGTPTDKFFLMF